jgi:hypothetical protein
MRYEEILGAIYDEVREISSHNMGMILRFDLWTPISKNTWSAEGERSEIKG